MARCSKLTVAVATGMTITMLCLFNFSSERHERAIPLTSTPISNRYNENILNASQLISIVVPKEENLNSVRKVTPNNSVRTSISKDKHSNSITTAVPKEKNLNSFRIVTPKEENPNSLRNDSDVSILQNLSLPHYRIVKEKGFGICGDYFKLRKTRVSNISSHYPIAGASICSDGSNQTRTLFVVPSVTNKKSLKTRQLIRKTWASILYEIHRKQLSDARLTFFFGSSNLSTDQLEALKKESSQYGDIVVGEYSDTYHNLSVKMAASFTWVAQNCPKVQTVVKVDMDTFVNIDLLLSLIHNLPVSSYPNYVFGHVHGANHPPVLRKGNWAVPESVYPYDEFPRYLVGHSYVVSGPAVRLMAQSFPFFPIVPNEDAFITGIMPVVLNITRFYHDSFATIANKKRTFCQMIQNKFVTAITQDENREKLWDAFQSKTCSDEFV